MNYINIIRSEEPPVKSETPIFQEEIDNKFGKAEEAKKEVKEEAKEEVKEEEVKEEEEAKKKV